MFSTRFFKEKTNGNSDSFHERNPDAHFVLSSETRTFDSLNEGHKGTEVRRVHVNSILKSDIKIL